MPTLHRRRLPHIQETTNPVFLTWRLHGSLPQNRHFPGGNLPSGAAFAALDRLLDETTTGPRYLTQSPIADLIVEALHYNARTLNHYDLHSYAVMPNHVHTLLTPKVPLPTLTKSLKGITAKRANALLNRTGNAFWQEETYDRTVRNQTEFNSIRHYIENNPVTAGLAHEASAYRWSSASPKTVSKIGATGDEGGGSDDFGGAIFVAEIADPASTPKARDMMNYRIRPRSNSK